MSRDNKTNILALFCYRSLLKDRVIGRAQKLGTGCRTLHRGESEAGRLRAWPLLSTAVPVQAVGVWHGRGDHDLSPRVHRHAWGRPESRAQMVGVCRRSPVRRRARLSTRSFRSRVTVECGAWVILLYLSALTLPPPTCKDHAAPNTAGMTRRPSWTV